MILCLGTTPAIQRAMVFKRLAVGEVNRAVEVIEAPAGKSVNVARVLRALGAPALAMGVAGGDRGDFLKAELTRAGIAHDFVASSARTRLCVTVIDRGGGTHTELVEESPPVEAEAWEALRRALRERLEGAKGLALSGTLAPGAPAAFYAECVRAAKEAGRWSIVDASGKALADALPARPDVVKPNRAELSATVGMAIDDEPSLLAAMRRMMDMGAGAVVVTMGSAGAMAMDGRSAWRIHIPRVEVVNSIGSGDAFCAGLAAALADGAELADACRLGTACGVANAMTLLAGEVDAQEVRRLEGRIRVEWV